ncbi:hypothetical protein BS17DRAFT_822796 [Gyrodon lividus]|nr:hypothetical protein BS17DRAFT_822796 [Gyrodon lividus]
MPHPTTRSHPVVQDSSPPPDNTDLFNLAVDTSADFKDLSFPGVLHSPHSLAYPVADTQGVASPSADHIPIREAAALAENVLDLPDPNAYLLLPGFQLATNPSSVVCSVPVQPEVLNGHRLALPAQVINVMKAN